MVQVQLLQLSAWLFASTEAAAAAGPRVRNLGGAPHGAPSVPLLVATNFTQGLDGFVAPAFLSNAFHGIRPGPIPLVADPYAGTTRPAGPYPGGTPTVPAVLAGYLHHDPKGKQQVLAASPFPFETEVEVEGSSLQASWQTPGRVSVVRQSFDMSDGTLRTTLDFVSAPSAPSKESHGLQLQSLWMTPAAAGCKLTPPPRSSGRSGSASRSSSAGPARCWRS